MGEASMVWTLANNENYADRDSTVLVLTQDSRAVHSTLSNVHPVDQSLVSMASKRRA